MAVAIKGPSITTNTKEALPITRIANPMELYRPEGQVMLTLSKKFKHSLFVEAYVLTL